MDYRNLPLNALRMFALLGDRLSVKQVAEELAVTPSAVSHQITSLEKQLGVPLLDKTARRVALTPDAERFHRAVRGSFDQLVTGIEDLTGQPGSRALVVSVAPYFSAQWLTPRLHMFWERYPDHDISIHHAYHASNLLREGIDLAIAWGNGKWPDAVAELLLPGDLVPLCTADFAREKQLRGPADLRNVRLLCEFDRAHWLTWFATAGVEVVNPLNITRIDDSHSLLRATIDGFGVSLFFKALLTDETIAHGLIVPFDIPVDPDAAYYLVRPAGRPFNRRASDFASWLDKELRHR